MTERAIITARRGRFLWWPEVTFRSEDAFDTMLTTDVGWPRVFGNLTKKAALRRGARAAVRYGSLLVEIRP